MKRVVAFSWLALMLIGGSAFAAPKNCEQIHKQDVAGCMGFGPGTDRVSCLQEAHDIKAECNGKRRGPPTPVVSTRGGCQADYKAEVRDCTQDAASGSVDLAVCLATARTAKDECMSGSDPGDTDPGDTDPGDTNPGDTDPGDTDPGGTNQCTTDCEDAHALMLQECDLAFDLGTCNLDPGCEAFMMSLRQGCYNTAGDDLDACLIGCTQ